MESDRVGTQLHSPLLSDRGVPPLSDIQFSHRGSDVVGGRPLMAEWLR
jgi:hypothetical protein